MVPQKQARNRPKTQLTKINSAGCFSVLRIQLNLWQFAIPYKSSRPRKHNSTLLVSKYLLRLQPAAKSLSNAPTAWTHAELYEYSTLHPSSPLSAGESTAKTYISQSPLSLSRGAITLQYRSPDTNSKCCNIILSLQQLPRQDSDTMKLS